MKFRTFKNLVIVGCVGSVAGLGYLVFHDSGENPRSAHKATISHPASNSPAPDRPAMPAPAPVPAAAALTTEQIRGMLEQWLSWNNDRGGKMFQKNILPQAPFMANAIRFPEADAAKFSNDPRQWSQFKIDLDRNGIADEKWLLKNGHTYKREALAADGKTVVGTAQYFNN